MTLDRQSLRQDVMAAIAAGRELPPDHDGALADVILDLTAPHRLRQELPGWLMGTGGRLRTAVAAVGLTLAAALFSFGLSQAARGGHAMAPAFLHHAFIQGQDNEHGEWWFPQRDPAAPGFNNPAPPPVPNDPGPLPRPNNPGPPPSSMP